jgi:Arc/MetJ family transcription regulator
VYEEAAAMKRTNIVLDEDLVARAKEATGIATTRQLVDHALHELLRLERQRSILKLRGRIDWQGDLSAMRRRRAFR